MANMGYCRFQNTSTDLKDCYNHLQDKLSEDEKFARRHIIQTCIDILTDLNLEVTAVGGDEVDLDAVYESLEN